MFERYTERVRQAVTLSQQVCRDYGDQEIDIQHLLVGIAREKEGLAAEVLSTLHITEKQIMHRVVGTPGESPAGQLPFTERCKKVLEGALREALSMGHNYIGTEHVLLGLLRLDDGYELFKLLDRDPEIVRAEVCRLVGVARSPRPGSVPAPAAVTHEYELVERDHEPAAESVKLDGAWEALAEDDPRRKAVMSDVLLAIHLLLQARELGTDNERNWSMLRWLVGPYADYDANRNAPADLFLAAITETRVR